MTRKASANDALLRTAWVVLAVIALVAVLAVRVRLLGIPLERDEGEYAYAGQLMLQGIPPYKLAYNMKFPGTYASYALVMAMFGQTIVGIHIGLLLVNAATASLIFLLGRRLVDWAAGIAAATTYAVLSLSPSVLGLAAHASHFVMLPVLGGTLLLLKPVAAVCDRGKSVQRHDGRSPEASHQAVPAALIERCYSELFVSGCMFGIGLLMKQPAIFFVLFGTIYLLFKGIRLRGAGRLKAYVPAFVFGLGALLPFALTCLLLWHAGVFDKFWFWTISYARQYGSLVPLSAAPKLFAEAFVPVIHSAWLLWSLAGIGLLGGLWNQWTRIGTLFLLAMFVFSFLTFSAGFYFREHYFIFILPAVSLFAGLAVSALGDLANRRGKLVRFAPILLFCVGLVQPMFGARNIYFEVSADEASRILYGTNPFGQTARVAEYVRDHSEASDTIAVLGSEPEIYFYSKRHSATGYIYTYALMEPQSYARRMQEEMIREIEAVRPKYLVSISLPVSWMRQATSDGMIFDWANDYINRYYDLVGLVDYVSRGHTDYYFDQLPEPLPQLENNIFIFRRKLE